MLERQPGFRTAANDNFKERLRLSPDLDQIKAARLNEVIGVSKFNDPTRWEQLKIREAETIVEGFDSDQLTAFINKLDLDINDHDERLVMYDAALRRLSGSVLSYRTSDLG